MSFNSDTLHKLLNPSQKKATLHRDGPLLILAGAGSGKTRTMAYRIAWLVLHHKISPSQILGLSFTNKAATELKERVGSLIKKQSPTAVTKGLTLCTFHSLCVRILRQWADTIGFQKNFTIFDSSDQESVIRDLLSGIQIDDRKFDPRAILFRISNLKNMIKTPGSPLMDRPENESDLDALMETILPNYQQTLKSQNAMDFDDLLIHTVEILEKNSEARDFYNEKFRYILVDEYQDTNSSQFRILRALTTHHKNICVVGDDDQSIYAWRGADPKHILEFEKYFPGAEKITLDQNYRSTHRILEAANHVISKNTSRYPKKMWSDRGEGEAVELLLFETDREEAKGVAEEIISLTEAEKNYGDVAILFRSNPQSRIFEEELRALQIPYELIGTYSFLDRKEIKDILSYLKLMVNLQDDTALRRIINWPKRSFGKQSLEKLNTYAQANSMTLFDALEKMESIQPKNTEVALRFRDLILRNRERLLSTSPSESFLSEWLLGFIEDAGFHTAFYAEEDDPKKAQAKLENVREIANALGQVPLKKMEEEYQEGKGTEWSSLIVLKTYLSQMLLQSLEEEEDENELTSPHKVKLMTLHASKGLEFPTVFLVGMDEGLMPHKRAIAEARDLSEERRLCYVGFTRAQNKLYLSRCKFRVRYGKKVPQNPSRFIEDLPKDFFEVKDETFTPEQKIENEKLKKQEHENRVSSFLEQIRNRISNP